MTRRDFLLACGLAGAGSQLLAATARIHVGCQTNAWPIQDFSQFLEVLGRIRKFGFECFETGFRNVQSRFQDAAAARREIEKAGLEFWAVHIFLGQGYDPKTAIPAADMIETMASGGAALGARRLIVSGRSLGSNGKVDAAALQAKAEGLDRAGKACRKHGLRFAYHNHDLEFQHGQAEIEGLIRRTSPELVSLVLDAGHAVLAGADPAEFFSPHAGRIEGIHLRDFRGQGRLEEQVPLGAGRVDYKPLAAAIKKAQWSGCVLAEEERLAGVKPGSSAVEPARRHLRALFGV
jgi:sugar phosphate isomerase/epimerase